MLNELSPAVVSLQHSQYAPTILVITFWNLQCFSTDRKQNVISSISNLVYELPHELWIDVRLRILGNQEIFGKSQICVET